jgi:hypothetical protein
VFELLLTKIAKCFDEAKIGYMVIGGQAVIIYGEPRFTRDIDITLAVDTDQLPIILKLAKNLKLRVLIDNPEDFAKNTKVLPVIDDSTGIRVDLIFSSSEFERAAISRVVTVSYENIPIKFVSVEDLIIHKIVSGRPRDIDDVKSILIKNPQLNQVYIEKWLREFDNALDTSYLDSFKNIAR